MPTAGYFALQQKAEDYRRKAAETENPILKRAYESVAAEFDRRAEEAKERGQ